jgi:hypothetical protein
VALSKIPNYLQDLIDSDAIGSSAITAAKIGSLPSGSVLQVVTTTKTNTDTSSSTGYVDVGLDATITPSSTSSKILISASVAMASNTASANVYFRIRNTTTGTSVSNDPYYTARWPSDGQAPYYCEKIHLEQIDSPSTTSATTYKIQMKTNAGAFQINMASNTGGGVTGLVSTVTLMEIAG